MIIELYVIRGRQHQQGAVSVDSVWVAYALSSFS